MTDYTELVKALRCCGNISTDCTVCPWDKYNFGMCAESLYTTAAAAIEALQAEADKYKTAWAVERENRLGIEEPKRGEIVRCKECIHFTQGGWCEREFDWFPVDENDFCSMAEKVEAQDGK